MKGDYQEYVKYCEYLSRIAYYAQIRRFPLLEVYLNHFRGRKLEEKVVNQIPIDNGDIVEIKPKTSIPYLIRPIFYFSRARK